jgi:hypothetical protein
LTACGGGTSGDQVATSSGVSKPANAIEVSIIYAPESALYLPQVIDDSTAYASSRAGDGAESASGESLFT